MDDEPTAVPGDDPAPDPTPQAVGDVTGGLEPDVLESADDEPGATDDGDDLGVLSDDQLAGRRNALPRRVESWRTRSATGAIATALAMGLQQVFEPEKRRPAIMAEAPSDPYSENDPVTVEYVPDDAEATIVHVRPWLLDGEDPA